MSNVPALSIVVPVYNSTAKLEICLKHLRASIFSDYELIVVDDGSSDCSRAIAKKYADLLIVHDRNLGRNQARMSGFLQARANLLVNIDSDILISPDILEIVSKAFTEPAIAAVTAFLSTENSEVSFPGAYKNLSLHYLHSRRKSLCPFLYGGFFAIRKELRELCVSTCNYADDTDLAFRLKSAGHSIMVIPGVNLRHATSPKLSTLFYSVFCMGRDWMGIARQIGFLRCLSSKEGILGHALSHLFKPPGFYFLIVRIRGLRYCVLAMLLNSLESVALLVGICAGFIRSLHNQRKSKSTPHIAQSDVPVI